MRVSGLRRWKIAACEFAAGASGLIAVQQRHRAHDLAREMRHEHWRLAKILRFPARRAGEANLSVIGGQQSAFEIIAQLRIRPELEDAATAICRERRIDGRKHCAPLARFLDQIVAARHDAEFHGEFSERRKQCRDEHRFDQDQPAHEIGPQRRQHRARRRAHRVTGQHKRTLRQRPGEADESSR